MRPRLLIVLAAVLAAAWPSVASADGDPASDILTMQDVYYPYQPKVSAPLQGQLDALAKATRARGLRVKLALIASPVDLGTQTKRFGKPASYATLLAIELEVHGTHELAIAVMPAGVGVDSYRERNLQPLRDAVAQVRPANARSADDLAIAGGRALIDVARAAHTTLPAAVTAPFLAKPSSAGASHGARITLLIVLALLLAAGLAVAYGLRVRASVTAAGGNV